MIGLIAHGLLWVMRQWPYCTPLTAIGKKGIIHRDIKPSNVLVTLHDGQPVPKVIDFGVAKALNTRLTDKTVYTEHVQVVGTLLYMSPEQAEFSGLDIDTRSDIYSLGVLLYELLTGTTPFHKTELEEAGFDEQRRIIREQEPPRASVRISSMGETATTIALHRKTDQRKLNQLLRGEIDWIVMKALEKDRTRRYETATGLANDVQRHLDDQPVLARPASTSYRFCKFFRRNKATVVGGVAVIAVLVAGIMGTSAGMWWAFMERERAQTALHSLSEELADRAIDAAFSGRKTEFDEALEKAKFAQVPDDLLNTLRGLASFFGGNNEESIRILEESAERYPDSVHALSALSWVYHHLNHQFERERTNTKLRFFASTPSAQPHEEFFLCLARFVGGPKQELRRTLTRLDELISRRTRWGAAYAIRANVRMEYAMETKELTDFQLAVNDFSMAQGILPDSTFVKSIGLYVLTSAIEFATSEDQAVPDWEANAERLATEFSSLADSTLAHSRAAVYFYNTGREERGRQIEHEFAKQPPSLSEHTAIRIVQKEPRAQIAERLRPVQNTSDQLSLALVLGLGSDTERVDANRLLGELTTRDVPAAMNVLLFDLAYLLGRPADVVETIKAKKLQEKMETEWRWWAYVTEFHSESGKINDEQLLALARPFSNASSMANYAIAVKAMGHGDVEKAKEYFRKTIATRRVGWWNYHWAQVFLKYLEKRTSDAATRRTDQ